MSATSHTTAERRASVDASTDLVALQPSVAEVPAAKTGKLNRAVTAIGGLNNSLDKALGLPRMGMIDRGHQGLIQGAGRPNLLGGRNFISCPSLEPVKTAEGAWNVTKAVVKTGFQFAAATGDRAGYAVSKVFQLLDSQILKRIGTNGVVGTANNVLIRTPLLIASAIARMVVSLAVFAATIALEIALPIVAAAAALAIAIAVGVVILLAAIAGGAASLALQAGFAIVSGAVLLAGEICGGLVSKYMMNAKINKLQEQIAILSGEKASSVASSTDGDGSDGDVADLSAAGAADTTCAAASAGSAAGVLPLLSTADQHLGADQLGTMNRSALAAASVV
jgi:hypothetical protein